MSVLPSIGSPEASIVFLVLAAFFAGVVDSIAGGGGLITLPALLATGLPPHLALATNKGQSSFGVVASFVSFWRRDGIDRDRVPVAFLGSMLGAIAGALLVMAVRPEPLRPLVMTLLVVAAIIVAMPRRMRPQVRAWKNPKAVLAGFALAIGFYDGFFGPGAGSLLIVGFTMLFGDTLTRASGNAKTINLASNLTALTLFAVRGNVIWHIALPMAAASAAGAFVGSRLAMRRGDRFVGAVVFCVVIAIVVKLGSDFVRH
ncbi:TSUP family transporter [Pendulispora brunnea]|uniref:Probable membrane transporter protein n=1 Tax=Pendulispora brunnea TaxID=2905690 RepID=A0ABZ2K879_9BACT